MPVIAFTALFQPLHTICRFGLRTFARRPHRHHLSKSEGHQPVGWRFAPPRSRRARLRTSPLRVQRLACRSRASAGHGAPVRRTSFTSG